MNPGLLAGGILALGVLGLVIGGAGAFALCRGKRTRGSFYALFGLLALAFAGGVGWQKWPLLQQLFLRDEDDEEAKERLGTKTLGGNSKEGRPDDWPQWRGSRRDGISPETGLLTAWPGSGPKVLWRVPVGGGYSSPAIVGDRIYLTDKKDGEERVLCLDRNGKEIWVYRYAVDYTGLDSSYAKGPRASPTVYGGRIYTVGASGAFLCLRADATGGKPELLWRHELLKEFAARRRSWGVACSPLVEGHLVIVQPGGRKGSIAAFDRKTGELRWTALDDASGYSSPVAATVAGVRQVICFTARQMVGLRPSDGSLLWSYRWTTPNDANIATPIVAENYVFLSSDYGRGCALLELQPAGAGLKVKHVYVRANRVMRNQFSTCVLHDNHLYGFDVSGAAGSLTCVDVRKGEIKWSTRDLEKGNVLYADGHLLVLTEGGILALVEATPKGYKRKAKAEVLEGSQCWALPALAGGRLYLRDNTYLVCLKLKK